MKELPADQSSIPGAIIIGSLIISFSILLSGGIIKIKGISPANSMTAGTPITTTITASAAPAPSAAPTKASVDLGKLPFKGNKDAKVTIIEFADFRCPFCERFFSDTEPQLMKDYVDSGKVRFAFRHFEFLGPASVTAGNAAECANEQNKFWDYYDYLYKNQPPESDTSMYNSDKLTTIAGGMGLDTTQFKSCLSDTKYNKNLTDDYQAAQAAGVSGTPTFIVGKSSATGVNNGDILVGAQPFSAFKTIIDQQLSQ